MSDSVSRRNALKALGAAPLVGAIELTPLGALQAKVERHAAAIAQGAAPKFFSAHEWVTVRLLADYVIPKDAQSGSATDAKVPEYMDFLLSEKDASEASQIAMRGGLAWLDTECRKRFAKTFVQSSDAQRRQVLDDIAWPKKAPAGMSYGVSFFNRFRDMTASGFFSSAIGWKDLKYMGNVFNPAYDGCPPAATDKLGVNYDVMNSRIAPQNK